MPLERERCDDIELTDENGILAGRFAPTVRKPVCKLPSGNFALGMGDVVVTNDPITGQGSNTASKAAAIYMKRIAERGDKPFDAQWMQETFDIFWDYAQWVVRWTNSLLVPPAPQVLQLMGAASQIPPLARRTHEGAARRRVGSVRASHAAGLWKLFFHADCRRWLSTPA